MKTILCYGDSNTFGQDPATGTRFPPDVRWTGILAAALGPGYRVIEEGLNGRTTVFEDPIEEYRCGKQYLPPCLLSHRPVDLVVLMLGTNDLKSRFNVTAFDIARGLELLVRIIQTSAAGPADSTPRVLIICPPPIAKLTDYADMFLGGPEKSRQLPQHYSLVASMYGCSFLNAGDVIASSDLDGIHFEASEHARLGAAVAERVQTIFAEKEKAY